MRQSSLRYTCQSLVVFAALTLLPDLSLASELVVRPWNMPNMVAPAAQPDLSRTSRGDWLLSWIEKRHDGFHAMRFSQFAFASVKSGHADGDWQTVGTIAQGNDWFVNWADTPHVIVLDDGSLWAHWLQRNGKGVYDYGIALTRSADSGASWSDPVRIEPKGSIGDYGFVSMWQNSRSELGMAWLDSRQKAKSEDAHDHSEHGEGRMMLRAAVFDSGMQRSIEWPLDPSTCDCCTTSSALTSKGPVLVYRGRSDDEIRDTRLVRFDGKRWTAPKDVHADGWKFAGCPVNGPAVVAKGNEVWVAWYTEAEGKPSLRLARSQDAGHSFASPLKMAEGEGVLGRAALAMEGDSVWLVWLVERGVGAKGQELWLARINAKTGVVAEKKNIASIGARGRATGLPRIQARDGAAWIVWTDSVDKQTILRGVSVRNGTSRAD